MPASGETLERRLLLAAVTLNGTAGGDTIELQTAGGNIIGRLNNFELFSVADSGIDEVFINGFGGEDTIYVDQTGTGNSVTVNGGDHDDTLYLADLNKQLAGNILSPVTFAGGNGTNEIVIDDALHPIGSGTVHRFPAEGSYQVTGLFTLGWTNVGHVRVEAGADDDDFVVENLAATTTLQLNGNGLNDLFTIGTTGSSHTTEGVKGTVNCDGGDGINGLLYDDAGNTFPDVYTLTDITLTRSFSGLVNYEQINELDILGGASDNGFAVLSTADGASTSIETGGGADTVDLGDGGSVELLFGPLSVLGGSVGGADVLNYNDGGNPLPDTYTLTGSTITRDFSALVTYSGFEDVKLFAGSADNIIDLTPSGQACLVDGGGGTDQLRVIGTPGDDFGFFNNLRVTLQALHENVERFAFKGNGGKDDLDIQSGITVELLDTVKLGSIGIAPGHGTLDLKTHDVLSDYTGASPLGSFSGAAYTGITGLIDSGHAGGTWDGNGLITSTAAALTGLTTLGIAEASDVLGLSGSATDTWDSFTVDATTVIVKYTYAGDANLDGIISGDDYTAIDFAIAVPGSSAWRNGDFNYDGIISGDDYTVIDFNIVAQGDPL